MEDKAVIKEEKYILPVRVMTRAQVRELRKAGHDIAFSGADVTTAETFEMIDWILDNVYADCETDTLPYNELVKLATATYHDTYGKGDEAKN